MSWLWGCMVLSLKVAIGGVLWGIAIMVGAGLIGLGIAIATGDL